MEKRWWQIRSWYKEWRNEKNMFGGDPNGDYVGGFVMWYFWNQYHKWQYRRCESIGHKWSDYSSAGPESGNINLVCDKCGTGHYVILY